MHASQPALQQAVEVIRLNVSSDKTTAFLEGRAVVETFTGSLAGHVATELLHLGGESWLMLIRWENQQAVQAAQKLTETAPIISDWLSQTAQFVSFATGIVEYVG